MSPDIPEWLSIEHQLEGFRNEQGPHDLVPFFAVVGDADRHCFDRDGRIVRWMHDDPDDRPVVDATFGDFLMGEIHELEQRAAQKRA